MLKRFGGFAPAPALAILALIWGAFHLRGGSDNRERLPDSVDPILRMAPIEKERIRPDRGSRPLVKASPDKQTFIFHPYPVKTDYVGRLAVLRVPNGFFTRHGSSEPSDVFGLNLVVQYPEMTNEFPPGRCGDRCGNQIWINLETYEDGRQSKAARRLDIVHEHIAKESARAEPLMLYSEIEKEGYDEAYREMKPSGAQEIHYFIKRSDRNVVEFALIRLGGMNPSVDLLFALPSHENLQVQIGFRKDHWRARTEIRDAVTRLIESFYDHDIEQK